MTDVAIRPEELRDTVARVLGAKAREVTLVLGEVTAVVPAADYLAAMQLLRDAPECKFDQLIDLCALDYSTWRDLGAEGPRFAVVVHLLSVALNQRLRVRVFCPDDDFPVLPSLCPIWSSANWFEREAFDLYGVVFDGHEDLRRILTDYGFIGHPFRKDFPLSGEVEMRYDETQRRVLYEPVSIEPREVTPRVIREEHYAGLDRGDQWLGGVNR
ncbi:NADH-quinone oxidoreductase subunit C [Comamonas sp. NLF-1-9]|uniref:NADH-quinone oxidoreductase subunit C n=1 Tax=Comamonas sp. NLF-1-9 TaxID=2853163 RepID=UPI001C471774|nr:NADH-quinone oxidoreductase subunit C [Comamonas sp. NLF-1-9]QXL84756.1 NADH-quinone oxidoreductase subunit C [Comamonas sp. NLF-1-9]